jgi:ABC-type sugar transport system substrate-binding protein
MKRTKFRALLILLVIALMISACSPKPEQSAEKYKIGVSFYSLSGEYNTNLRNAIEGYYETNNLKDTVELTILDATGDANTQNSQVETLIADKVDSIILIAGDADAQAVVVKESIDAGIPVIELCTSTAALDIRTSYVGSDDIVAGRMLMEYLGGMVGGKGKMVILHGPAGISAEISRHQGAAEILQEKGWDIEIVAEKHADWDRAMAMSAMENFIQSGLDFNIVFAENDEMAIGALAALEGMNVDVAIGGIDAIPDAIDAVLDGTLDVTIFQDAVTQGEKALEVALLAAKGEQVEKVYDVPFVLVLQDTAQDYK